MGIWVHFSRVFWVVVLSVLVLVGTIVKGSFQPWLELPLLAASLAVAALESRRGMQQLRQYRNMRGHRRDA